MVKQRQTEQVIGREAGTATFLSRCPFTFGLRVARSRPRQCRRSMPRGEMMKMFESEVQLLSTLDKYDELVDRCASEDISFQSFLQKYDNFYLAFALDGHESDREEQALFEKHKNRIALHREIWEKVIAGGLCADEDAQKEAYIQANRFGSGEGLRRLKEIRDRFSAQ